MDVGNDLTSEFTTGPDTIQILNLKINQIDHFAISGNAHTDHPDLSLGDFIIDCNVPGAFS